jgi:hypothetical protein
VRQETAALRDLGPAYDRCRLDSVIAVMSAAWPFLLRKRKDQGKRKRPPCRWPVHSASTSERASQPRSRGTAIINGSSSIRTGKRRRSRIAPALSRTTLGCCVRLRWPALASCSFRVLWSGKTSAPGVLSMSCRNGNRAAPSSMRCSHRGTVCSHPSALCSTFSLTTREVEQEVK